MCPVKTSLSLRTWPISLWPAPSTAGHCEQGVRRRERSGRVHGPTAHPSPGPTAAATHVLHTAMVWQASPVQNSEMVLYCRLTWWKNVVAAREEKGGA